MIAVCVSVCLYVCVCVCLCGCCVVFGFSFSAGILYVVYNNNNSVYICKECQRSVCVCVSSHSLILFDVYACVCCCVFVSFLGFNNLRANRLGQWILSDAYLVALCAIVEGAGCVSGHICPIAIPIAILHIQLLLACRFVCIVVVSATAATADAAAAAAIDGRLTQSIADAQA